MLNTRKDILRRVYLVYFGVLLFGIGIVVKAVYIQFAEGEALMEKAKEQELKYFNIEAIRGNILARDGSLLASSIPSFEVRMDVDSEHISDKFFNEKVDSLSYGLSRLFKDRSVYQYKQLLEKARKSGNRYLLLKRKVTYQHLKELRTFPILRKGKYRGGLIIIPQTIRKLPYKELARRTIGYENEAENIHVGLEGAYNSILKGVNGKQLRRRISNGEWKPVWDENELEPENGRDIVTSVDINIQDVAEHALLEHLREHEALQGCVVLMEVRTGEIRAIANLKYDSASQQYEESYNYAIGESVEPGSTFKLASMITALESGQISLIDTIDTGDGWTTYYGSTMQDVHKIRDGRITYREAFEQSSNVGISLMIDSIYRKHPEKYIELLYRMSLNQSLGIELPGEGEPFIRHPSNKKIWYGTTLPWMSIGYGLTMTPLQILTFYNAIANNGVMVKPMFVSEIRYAGSRVKKLYPEIINEAICSQAIVDTVRSLLEGVVERGTAKILNNTVYKVAGKTGTALIAKGKSGYGNKEYNASFVGYFPADDPKYSCIVFVNRPRRGKIYGGSVAAPVFREIADKVYATQLDIHTDPDFLASGDIKPVPAVIGRAGDLEKVFAELGYRITWGFSENEWVRTSIDNNKIKTSKKHIPLNYMPNVVGMSARDATYVMEQLGLNVNLTGKGKVKFQSVMPGDRIKPGTDINLRLSMI